MEILTEFLFGSDHLKKQIGILIMWRIELHSYHFLFNSSISRLSIVL